MPPNTVKVDHSTDFGNPFLPFDPRQTEQAVTAFRRYVTGNIPAGGFACGPGTGIVMAFIPPWWYADVLRKNLLTLRGKNLACWCPPDRPCHADVLLELANEPIESAAA